MDRKIFEMSLSVEATSLYLLLVPLAEGGVPLNRDSAMRFWNSQEDKLDDAIDELLARCVIQNTVAGDWLLLPPSSWVQLS